VAKKRGFIAELIYQQELAEKHRQQASAQQVRSQQRAAEQAERHRIRMQELEARNDRYSAAQAIYEARLGSTKFHCLAD
jgi:hypothetical protein